MTLLTTSPTDLLRWPAQTGRLQVICLCAAWCGTCTSYRHDFIRLSDRFSDCAFMWLDVEDDAEWVNAIDTEDFPTLLIARSGQPLFFGTLLPQEGVLIRLIENYQTAQAKPALKEWPQGVVELAQRLDNILPPPFDEPGR